MFSEVFSILIDIKSLLSNDNSPDMCKHLHQDDWLLECPAMPYIDPLFVDFRKILSTIFFWNGKNGDWLNCIGKIALH